MAMTPIHDGARLWPRYRMVLSRCAAAAACALLAAACGSTIAPGASSGGSSSTSPSSTSSGSTSTGSTSTGSAGPTSAAKVSLEVSFPGSATIPASHYTLRCEPAGGTVRDAAVACAALLKGGATLFGPPARQHVMCPMMLASAGRATVTGTYLGKPVHESISDGGCDQARWSTLREIFN